MASQVDRMLMATPEIGTAQRLGQLDSTVQFAAKTGTTDEGRDGWFVAADQRTLGVAWVGFDDNRAGGLTGGRAALPVIAAVFRAIPRQTRRTPVLDGFRDAFLNAAGVEVDPSCPGARAHAVPVDVKLPRSRQCDAQSGQGGERGWWQQWFGGG
ncbi:MAG: hypothetical protein EBS77_08975 [Gammaproteobacteria bacterium]|nr:hypothetical protein [Gammaproteobacteria bacterium]